MLGIKLRGKRTRFIPIGRVSNLYRSCSLNAPRLLVHFFDECFLGAGKCFNLLYMTAEVTNLVERIPSGHAHEHFAGYVGNGHRHVEEMPLGMIQQDHVLNCCSGRRTESQDKEKAEAGGDQQPAPRGNNRSRVFASPASCTAAPSFFRSFSHRPSKLPLDMMRRRSPGLASPPRCSAMASELGTTRAALPKARTLSPTVSRPRRSSYPHTSTRHPPPP